MLRQHVKWKIIHSEIVEWAQAKSKPVFDAVLCDPPYELGFMGKSWDKSFVSFNPETWAAILGMMKPGAFLMSFGGTRTHHRIACAIEDGGFVIRDELMWLYGSGFPKSIDIARVIDKEKGAERKKVGTVREPGYGKMARRQRGDEDDCVKMHDALSKEPVTELAGHWKGWGTALKPAWEPITLAQKPFEGTYAENVEKHGCGALCIDAGRIATGEEWEGRKMPDAKDGVTWGGDMNKQTSPSHEAGRFPANIILDEESAKMLDSQSGESKSAPAGFHSRKKKSMVYGGSSYFESSTKHQGGVEYGDTGGASRFFYCAKANSWERNAGLEDIIPVKAGSFGKDSRTGRVTIQANVHPTVKPIDLCRYLAALLLPPVSRKEPRRILVPFSGSGSEMIGAMYAGWDEIYGVEMDEQYVKIAQIRLKYWQEEHRLSQWTGTRPKGKGTARDQKQKLLPEI